MTEVAMLLQISAVITSLTKLTEKKKDRNDRLATRKEKHKNGKDRDKHTTPTGHKRLVLLQLSFSLRLAFLFTRKSMNL